MPRPSIRSVLQEAESRVVSTLLGRMSPGQWLTARGLVGGNLLMPPGSQASELLWELDAGLLLTIQDTLKRSDITLWICANEKLAVIVYYCLRQLGVRLPEDLSLMCIDSDVQTLALRITTYTICVDEAVTAALNVVIRPSTVWGHRGAGLRRMSITGRIQERSTVKALRQPRDPASAR